MPNPRLTELQLTLTFEMDWGYVQNCNLLYLLFIIRYSYFFFLSFDDEKMKALKTVHQI